MSVAWDVLSEKIHSRFQKLNMKKRLLKYPSTSFVFWFRFTDNIFKYSGFDCIEVNKMLQKSISPFLFIL